MARRKRFHVETVDGRRVDALAWDRDDAIRLLESRGYTVKTLVSAAARKAATPTRWDTNTLALQRACRYLHIEWKVNIRRTDSKVTGRNGSQTCIPERREHFIRVRKDVNYLEAARVLRHELAHAMQTERTVRDNPHLDPREVLKTQHRRQMRYRYATRPIEVEARAYEDDAYLCALNLTRPA